VIRVVRLIWDVYWGGGMDLGRNVSTTLIFSASESPASDPMPSTRCDPNEPKSAEHATPPPPSGVSGKASTLRMTRFLGPPFQTSSFRNLLISWALSRLTRGSKDGGGKGADKSADTRYSEMVPRAKFMLLANLCGNSGGPTTVADIKLPKISPSR
jgi:hypothetical protein